MKKLIFPLAFAFALNSFAQEPGQLEQNKITGFSEQKYDSDLFPNCSVKSIMTPTAWGSNSTFVFGSVGGTFPQPYRTTSDLAANVGFGAGDPFRFVSVVGILNVNDVSKVKNFSGSFLASRYLGKGSSISVGALNLFFDPKLSDAGSSYYFVVSHAVQTLPSKSGQASRLTYSIGAGSGRFYDKSDRDKLNGKGVHGTAIFSNVSYEILKNLNLNAEWTGLNLGFGTAWRPTNKLPALAIGVTDVTGSSSDRLRLVCGFGHAFIFNKKSK